MTTTPTPKPGEGKPRATNVHKTTFANLSEGSIFLKARKSNPVENDYLFKSGKKSANYCDRTGRKISSHFLMARDEVVFKLRRISHRRGMEYTDARTPIPATNARKAGA